MKTELRTLTFSEKESICEREFEMSGPFWHLFNDGKKMQDIYLSDEIFELAETLLAVSCCKYPKVKVITFELMTNHLHLIASGLRAECIALFDDFKQRQQRVFKKTGIIVDWDNFEADIIPIDNLKALRNEIVYTNRNAYVANPGHTPSNYPWGGGYAYFCPLIKYIEAIEFDKLTYDRKRQLAHCRNIDNLSRLRVKDGLGVLVTSFCDISLGERMFQDARSYFNSLTRNAEAFSLIAERLKDSIFLTDEELFNISVKYAETNFGTKTITMLSPEHKIQLAKELHFRYKATNQQIRRILRMDIHILNEMFP